MFFFGGGEGKRPPKNESYGYGLRNFWRNFAQKTYWVLVFKRPFGRSCSFVFGFLNKSKLFWGFLRFSRFFLGFLPLSGWGNLFFEGFRGCSLVCFRGFRFWPTPCPKWFLVWLNVIPRWSTDPDPFCWLFVPPPPEAKQTPTKP